MLSKRQTDRQANYTKRVYLSNPVKIGTEKKNFEFPHQKNQINNPQSTALTDISLFIRLQRDGQGAGLYEPPLHYFKIGSTGIWKALELRT